MSDPQTSITIPIGKTKVTVPNPVGMLLNYLFPKKVATPVENGNATPDQSATDPDLGMTADQIKTAAANADKAFAAVLTIASSAAVAATGGTGAPFVATAAAAVGTYWGSLPAKQKAAIWVKGGPIAQTAAQAAEAKAQNDAAYSAAKSSSAGTRSTGRNMGTPTTGNGIGVV